MPKLCNANLKVSFFFRYLEVLLKEELKDLVEIITPKFWRGCQLSVRFKMDVEKVVTLFFNLKKIMS